MSPCCELNLIAEMLTPNASAAQLNLARADLRRVADRVKELEMFRLEMLRNEAKETDIAERQARLAASKVVRFPGKGRVPVFCVGDQ
jgi:hypothetical protein